MKKFLKFSLLLLTFSCFVSCDFLRTVAGRPTSSDLQKIRDDKKAEEVRAKAVADSLNLIKQYTADSLAAQTEISTDFISKKSSELRAINVSTLESEYYFIIGAFSEIKNAQKSAQAVADAGYSYALLSYRNGQTAVGVCPSDDVVEFLRTVKKVRTEEFCPEEAWILIKE